MKTKYVFPVLILTVVMVLFIAEVLFPVSALRSLGLLGSSEQPKQVTILETYGQLPLSFDANKGQADPQVHFLT
jgi:hypothetical protein